MCSLRRLVCWGEIFGTFWGVELIPVKNGNQHWKRLLGGDVFPQTNHNHPFCLGSLSEDLHCSYCWWWFLSFFWGEKIWKNRPETWGISMLFHSPGWRKKKQNKQLFEELQWFFLCFFFEISEFWGPKLEGEGTERIQMVKGGNAGWSISSRSK